MMKATFFARLLLILCSLTLWTGSAQAFTTSTTLTATDPLGNRVDTAYNAKGNPSAITDPTGRVTQITYNSLGQPTSLTLPTQAGANLPTVSDGIASSVRGEAGVTEAGVKQKLGSSLASRSWGQVLH